MSARVGFSVVPQQTPRAITGEPPLLFTMPPVLAEVAEMSYTGFVVTVGRVSVNVLPTETEAALTDKAEKSHESIKI